MTTVPDLTWPRRLLGGPGHQFEPVFTPAPAAPPANRVVVAIGLVIWVALAAAVWATAGPRMAGVLGLGLALGVTLFHSRFGFTGAWRQLVAVGQGAALRAHMLMLAVAAVLFSIILPFGLSVTGSASPQLGPVGIPLFVGSFLFGVGMQLGGSCASGTLFSVGSGQTSILYTLVGFVLGSMASIGTFTFWTRTVPQGPVVNLAAILGYPGALAVSLVVMGGIVAVTVVVGRRRNPPPIDAPPTERGLRRVLRGSWPLWVGAVLLGVLNAAVLVVSGQPWGVTSAFGLWGSKIAALFGAHPAGWAYFQVPANARSLAGSVLADRVSVLDFGIMAGALVASALGGAFVLHRAVPWRTVVAALLGGVLMGYGARLAGGCNIGAYFSGIASFSLHGWLWGLTAIVGTVAGLALRPVFGLANPKPSDSRC
ncbi:YeeE/YedE family protein [Actinomycetospora sp. TBRC 11914]|uniref:YeeE/YedE family protein n=1 Tax=Actinomycetospora sp. TBRC 11914 TaxID=2729387 RepID=UPI00145CAE5C|nr:YeeE/YedE family protein [Actinomycetospora sp. TBRC 11914]NMO91442.1 YeeE/YedE family protein [Actinomycetospora sp. TBRC 11914]